MKFLVRIFFSYSALVFFLSCNTNNEVEENHNLREIYLKSALENIKRNIRLSEIADEINYIKLETSGEAIINRIDRLVIFNNYIFICNKEQFFQFDNSGNFIRSFGSKGKGPGEYIYIRNFAIHPKLNLLSIYDSELAKVINYDLNGNFISEFQIDGYPNLIAYSKEGKLNASWVLPRYYYNEYYSINVYDNQGNILDKMLNRSNEGITAKNVGNVPSTSRTRFEYFNDTLSYWEVNYHSICRVVNGDIIPRYKIINNFTPKIEDFNTSQIQEDKFIVSDLIETSRYIFMTKGIYENDVYHVIYDKVHREVNAFQVSHEYPEIRLNSGFINDIDGGYPFLPLGLISKDKAYCTFFAYEMKNMLSDEFFAKVEFKNEDGHEQLLKILEDSNLEDNPIIMIVKLKSL